MGDSRSGNRLKQRDSVRRSDQAGIELVEGCGEESTTDERVVLHEPLSFVPGCGIKYDNSGTDTIRTATGKKHYSALGCFTQILEVS